MNARTLFISGTDTGVGKTRAAVALLHVARELGIDAVGFKPVAAGCELGAQGWRNDDALQLAAAGAPEPYELINPVALPAPIAPHLAAREVGTPIRLEILDAAYAQLAQRHELVIVEGAGGWRVPLTDGQDFADWVAVQGWPVVLVVGLRLGCLNHAALSAESISRQTRLAGWIGNWLPPAQPYGDDNLLSLAQRLPAPRLGVLPEAGEAEANRAALNTAATRALLSGRD